VLVRCVLKFGGRWSRTGALGRIGLGLGLVFGCMSPVDTIFKCVCVCVCVCVGRTVSVGAASSLTGSRV